MFFLIFQGLREDLGSLAIKSVYIMYMCMKEVEDFPQILVITMLPGGTNPWEQVATVI